MWCCGNRKCKSCQPFTYACEYCSGRFDKPVANGDVYVCSSLASRLVYTDCTVTDIFDDNTSIYENPSLSFPWTGYFLDGTDIYESTWIISGDVTFIGICGASCQ